MSMIFQAAEVVKSAVFITILQAAYGYEGIFFFLDGGQEKDLCFSVESRKKR
jgi:hypothetical protein